MELYKVFINYDLGMTLVCFTARSTWVAYAFEWGNLVKCYKMGGKLAGSMQMDRRFMFMKKKLSSRGYLPLSRGYIHVYDNDIQIFFSETAWPIKAKH